MKRTNKASARRAIEARKAHAAIFKFASSAADEQYFRKWIQNWLLTPSENRPSWNQLLHRMVEIRNKDPKELKYCHFNDYLGQTFVNKDFQTWATRVREAMKTAIKKYYA